MKIIQHSRLAIVAAVALALGSTAACGSDSKDEPKTAAAIKTAHKADFVVQGNALCKKANEKIGSQFATMSQPPKPAEMTAAYATILKESYKLNGDLLAIGAPAGQENAWVALILQLHQVTEGVENQGQEAFFADESDPWEPVAAKIVKDFGLTECGAD